MRLLQDYADNHTFLLVDSIDTGGRTCLSYFNFDTQIDQTVDEQQLSKSDLQVYFAPNLLYCLTTF